MFTDCRAASKLAKEVAAEGGALTLGGVSQCPSYLTGKSKEEVQAEFRKQIKVFVEEDLDFLLCEVIISLSLCAPAVLRLLFVYLCFLLIAYEMKRLRLFTL